ncbi:hypothetical protein [uncultured Hymenobacter sp.]|uniref:hypothetical protein n=1 Tax=uncultured Hymenobacter sp. TaxID=170016 RepID=UPI0035CA114F
MKASYLVLIGLGLGIGSQRTLAQTSDAPRQLGNPPRVPPPTRPLSPPPRQLSPAPAIPPAGAAPALPPTAPPTPGYSSSESRRPAPRYQVGLKNGQLFSAAEVSQQSPLFGPTFLLLDGQQRLSLEAVRFYEDETGHYVRARPVGTLRETTYRRVLSGRLSLYQPRNAIFGQLAGGAAMLAFGGPGPAALTDYRRVAPLYFGKDDGPVQHLNHHNLTPAIQDNVRAQTLETRAHRYELGNAAATVVGSGLLLAGLVRALQQLGGANLNGRLTGGLLLGSLPVLAVPLVLKNQPAKNRRQVIALYNAGL